MYDGHDSDRQGWSINRREVLKQSVITGGALGGFAGVGSGTGPTEADSAPIESVLESDVVQSIAEAVPNLHVRAKNARVTAEHREATGRTVRVPGRPGTLYATELPGGSVVSMFRFPNDIPRRELNVEEKIPEGANAMLVGSPDGAYLLRSAGSQERQQIRDTVDFPSTEDVHVTTTSRKNTFEVAEMDLEAEQIKRTVVRPQDDDSTTPRTDDGETFEIVSESVFTAGSNPSTTMTTQSCNCGGLVSNIVLCIHSLGGCTTSLRCAPFGGPKAVVVCAIATGCIYSILSEMFLSDAPGCTNLGRDLWNLCATRCIY